MASRLNSCESEAKFSGPTALEVAHDGAMDSVSYARTYDLAVQ